jgi:tRNA/tmRNA/rRNA uracil-C5-methylase (TrmA/RlmC/RlmD family)
MTLEYANEFAAKARAATAFWNSLGTPAPCAPLVRSPRGRQYRTVSKRKAFRIRGGLRLGFVGPADHPPPGGIAVETCAIEPSGHAPVYRVIEEVLLEPLSAPLRETLLYAVIKGNYREQTVILNVGKIAPAIVRTANTLSKALTKRLGNVIAGVFLFEGDPDGRYYLTAKEKSKVAEARKLFGKNELFVRVDGRSFLYPPLSFSQVNESLLDLFVAGARELLSPVHTQMLYDLYCGYGLFALCLAPAVRAVLGVEAAHQSTAAATANARRQHVANARFVRAVINEYTIGNLLQKSPPQSLVLLDPPRGGTSAGVIEAIAERRPTRVLHIFCDMDILPGELQRWGRTGYAPTRAVPFDMFPGTADLEMMVLMEFSP